MRSAVAMKSQSAIMLAVAAGNAAFTTAARESMTVEEGGISFQIDRYDDGRSKPYRVVFTNSADGVDSTFRYEASCADAPPCGLRFFVLARENFPLHQVGFGDLRAVTMTCTVTKVLFWVRGIVDGCSSKACDPTRAIKNKIFTHICMHVRQHTYVHLVSRLRFVVGCVTAGWRRYDVDHANNHACDTTYMHAS